LKNNLKTWDMKTSNNFRNTALVLLLGMSATLTVAQSLKAVSNNLIREKMITGLNASPVAGLLDKSASRYTGLSEKENNSALENAGYWIDAVVVNYDNKKADKNEFSGLGYLIDPIVVTYNNPETAGETSVNPAEPGSEYNESSADIQNNGLEFQGYRIDPVVVNFTDGDGNNAFRKNTEFIPSEILPTMTDGTEVESSVQQQVEYPERAIAQHIEGEVLIQFTVDAEGNLTDTRILKDIGGHCGIFAAKTVANMKFKPAMQNGFPVPCKMVIPVQFRLL
jgi:TonB family protein